MERKNTFLVKKAYLVEVNEEEFHNNIFDEILKETDNFHLGSERFSFEPNFKSIQMLEPSIRNCGRCSNCGQWTTDKEKPESIEGLCNGATVDGRLLCDECLPSDHGWAF